jgi:hypothetical protein
MVVMDHRVRIGSMIHRNRAALAEADEQLSKIAGMMPLASRVIRRQLRQMAREARWERVRLRLVGWVLRFLDTR